MTLALLLAAAAAVSWPVRYNDGVTTYQSNDFAAAASAFEQATAAPDRALQERAHYNLGNASYRLGEAQPAEAQQLWERAVKSYESALALDPNDADAKFNRDFVKKKLEELQKQKEQQQQEQQKNQQDQKKEENKQDQQQSQDQKQNQQKQSENQKQDQQKKQEQQKPEQSQQAQKQKKQDQEQKEQQQQQQASEPRNLDKQQAAALLDNLREDERNWNFFPEVQMKDLKDSQEPTKDW